MYKFDKKFVHFMWDDELEGKEGFYADNIGFLIMRVESNNTHWYGVVYKSGDDIHHPFCADKNHWRLFYHDPHYKLKLAHEQGKVIQFNTVDGWKDMKIKPRWNHSDDKYRIKPDEPKPVTNRELVLWLAQGNGLVEYDGIVGISWSYGITKPDAGVRSGVAICKWDDTEWHEPTREYMGLI